MRPRAVRTFHPLIFGGGPRRPDKMARNGLPPPNGVPPPFQLIRGDTYNLTLGVMIAVILAACKVPRRQHVTAHPHARVGPAPH